MSVTHPSKNVFGSGYLSSGFLSIISHWRCHWKDLVIFTRTVLL